MNCPIVLLVDFDETLVINNPFPNIEGFVDKADYYIRKLYDEGYYIIIWTCRHAIHEDQAKDYLIANNIPFHQINKHHPALVEHYGNDTRKCSGDIVIDDKILGGLPHWDEIYKLIKSTDIKNPVLSFLNN